MSEQTNDGPKGDGPQWVPYQPPPPSGGERVWMTVRRMAFPVLLVLFMAGLGGLLYLSSDLQGAQSVREWVGIEASPSAPMNRTPSAAGGTTTTDGSAPRSSTALGGGAGATATGDGRLGTGYANLSVFSEPAGASVLVDGDSVGTTPLNRYSIPSGVYIITVERDSFFAADTVAVLRNNQAPTYSVTLNPRPPLPDDQRPALADRGSASPSGSGSATDAPSSSTPADPSPPTSSSTASSSAAQDAAPPAPTPEPAPTTGTLRFVSTPAGARVQLDGAPVGETPLTLNDMDAGAYDVTFTRPGYDTLRTQVALSPAEERTVQGALNPQPGRLRVLARPWGSIYIDGDLHERNADVWYETTMPPGTYDVEAIHPALGRQSRTVTVAAGEQVSIVIDLRSPAPSPDGVVDTVQRDTTGRSDDPS